MNFMTGQDDFFQTANQPISVRHLSHAYNKNTYYLYIISYCIEAVKLCFAQANSR